jgi:beta,beta-carotene 9',10'-dioxygenase
MDKKYLPGFQTQPQEIRIDRLPSQGVIPSWLSGTLVRNGPAQFEVADRSLRHWFDGFAMLHKFSFHDGQVSYANRFLQSKAHQKATKTGRISYREFATDPCRSIFGRLMSMFLTTLTDNTNVNVINLADRFVAMTEVPLAVEFAPDTLETAGVIDYRDSLRGQVTTAHPHWDATKAEAINYLIRFSYRSSYQIFGIRKAGGPRRLIGSVPIKEPAYMHSFAMTERYVVLVEFPLVVSPLRLLLSGRPFIENYRWKPERGTRFQVIDRNSGKLRGTYEADPFFAFHHVNAFERDGELIVDLAAYQDATVIDTFYLDKLRHSQSGIPASELRRYRIPLNGSVTKYELLADESIELPRIHYLPCNGRDYAFTYGASVRKDSPGDFFNQLVRINVQSGSTVTWSEPDCYPGEPVFVAAPEAQRENEGVILSVVLDSKEKRSFLVVLDASTFAEIGRAYVPQHIPFGFHGQYFGAVPKTAEKYPREGSNL